MITKTGNQLGEYLKNSQSANTSGPLVGKIDVIPDKQTATLDFTNFVESLTPKPVWAVDDPADKISDYLAKTPTATPDQLVRDLGLKVSAVMTALDKLQRFGFVQMTQDSGKTTVSLVGQP